MVSARSDGASSSDSTTATVRIGQVTAYFVISVIVTTFGRAPPSLK